MSALSTPMRPLFFCSRPNGTLTPLIALDELPSNIVIRGVPRTLTPGDTVGMTSLGTVAPRAQFYIVDGAQLGPIGSIPFGHANTSRDIDSKTPLYAIGPNDALVFDHCMALQTVSQQHDLSQNWMTPTAAGPGCANQLATIGSGHSNGKQDRRNRSGSRERRKVYCSYWIRTGECDYTQQGCKFKHEMPMDAAGLAKCGLRDIPQWYRDKFGVPSLHARGNGNGNGHPRPQIGSGQNWRNNTRNSNHSTPTKSLPCPPRMGITVNNEVPQGPNHAMGFDGESNNKNFLVQQAHKTKKLDLLSFDPLPEYPTLNPVRDESSNETVSPVADKLAAVGGADFRRTQNADWLYRFGPMLPGPVADPDSPIKDKGRAKKIQKSRRLYEPRAVKGGVPIEDVLTSLKTQLGNVAIGSNETSPATKSPPSLGMVTPDLTMSPDKNSSPIRSTPASGPSPHVAFSQKSLIFPSQNTKAMINDGESDTLSYLAKELVQLKLAHKIDGDDDDIVCE